MLLHYNNLTLSCFYITIIIIYLLILKNKLTLSRFYIISSLFLQS